MKLTLRERLDIVQFRFYRRFVCGRRRHVPIEKFSCTICARCRQVLVERTVRFVIKREEAE